MLVIVGRRTGRILVLNIRAQRDASRPFSLEQLKLGLLKARWKFAFWLYGTRRGPTRGRL
jgi:hypothetical protein